ncbi:hypothetical protein L6164_011221 [Bauhinia variegata]|uniref:Uncharacterized protein n=1 Tax=Bauhinia variegata TaxID=167791 RepID=A0ACB9P540_BAUVA|nr:hypothetical protein L6164_011221 [Bauhinia variegata]
MEIRPYMLAVAMKPKQNICSRTHMQFLRIGFSNKLSPLSSFCPKSSNHGGVRFAKLIAIAKMCLKSTYQERSTKRICSKDLRIGAIVDSEKVCTICNTACNSQEIFDKHLAGKKHAAKVGLISHNVVGSDRAAFQRNGIGYCPKRVETAQSIWCEICNIRVTAANALQYAASPIFGSQKKPGTDKHEEMSSQKSLKAITSDVLEKDLEMKKRKALEMELQQELFDGATIRRVKPLKYLRYLFLSFDPGETDLYSDCIGSLLLGCLPV